MHKNKCLCFNQVTWLMTMKIKLEIKNRSNRYDINRLMPRHGYKYTKYKTCLSIMMVICIKEHLSNIWSSIHDKFKQHWGWVEKSVAYKKSVQFIRSKTTDLHKFNTLFNLTIYIWRF